MNDVLVDAGFLVALFDRDDDAHRAAAAAIGSMREPLLTVWPAITESMYFLQRAAVGADGLLDMIEDGAVRLLPLGQEDASRMKALMRQYRDLPMDFADAALVRVAERDGLKTILSFDRHFRVYRLPRRGSFEVLP